MSQRSSRQPAQVHLVGVGLDNQDGHKRVTRGEEFTLVGGSSETHERMTETVIKTVEDLQSKGKRLREAEPQEVVDLLHKHSSK